MGGELASGCTNSTSPERVKNSAGGTGQVSAAPPTNARRYSSRLLPYGSR